MPSTPTSKSQVQAYRFVIRRMQSALVRKDAVMLHDPMRTHTRATVVGAILGVIVLIGFLVVSLLSPANKAPDKGILISAQSGRVYVYGGKHPKLIPTTNLASARLLYSSLKNKGNSGKGGSGKGGSGEGGGSGGENGEAVEPQTIDDTSLKELENVQMGRLTGIADGPDIIPAEDDQRAKGMWAVCDDISRQLNRNNPTAEGKPKTTAIAGVHKLGDALKQHQALLVRAPNDQEYLIYRTPSTVNIDPNSSLGDSDAVRAKVDASDTALNTAFKMSDAQVRPISTALLNAIPKVGDLKLPEIANQGASDSFGLGIDVGNVFQVTNTDGSHSYYLVLQHGIEEVNSSVAQLARAAHRTGSTGIPSRELSRTSGVPKTQKYDFDQFPKKIPDLLNATTAPTVCLGWSVDHSDPEIPKVHTEVTVGKRLPLPSEKDKPVPIATPNPGGEKIDSFWMPSGTAAVIRSAASAQEFTSGPISVVTGRGVRYGVPDMKTAKIVGLSSPDPAPASIVHLLPSGTELNMANAHKTYDSLTVPSNVGSYPPADGEKQSGSGGN